MGDEANICEDGLRDHESDNTVVYLLETIISNRENSADSAILHELLSSVTSLLKLLQPIRKSCEFFDFKDVKANGFRSVIIFVERSFSKFEQDMLPIYSYFENNSCLSIDKKLMLNSYLNFFTSMNFIVDSSCELLQVSLEKREKACSQKISKKMNDILLLHDSSHPINLMYMFFGYFIDRIFYGPHLGFQYTTCARNAISNISSIMAGYYASGDEKISSLIKIFKSVTLSSKYHMKNLDKAKILETLLRNPPLSFVKSFWNLTETPLLVRLINLVPPMIVLNRDIELPKEYLQNSSYGDINVCKSNSIKVRLFASEYYDGIVDGKLILNKAETFLYNYARAKNSNNLIFHIPGGGFIAQTPNSHQDYLKDWCKSLNTPVISVHYSKGPESPFPVGVEDCFFAYTWVVNNLEKFGCSGKKILLFGDSAGGNMCCSMIQIAMENNIRLPDALILVYPNLVFGPNVSPSRLLSIYDILIPMTVMDRCLEAYLQANVSDANFKYFVEACDLLQVQSSRVLNNCSDTTTTMIKEKIENLKKEESNFHNFGYGTKEFFENRIELYNNVKCFIRELTTTLGDNLPEDFHSPELYFKEFWNKFRGTIAYSPKLSPLLASIEVLRLFPETAIIVSDCDPFLDEAVEFCKALDRTGTLAHLNVVQGLPHGFLQFKNISSAAEQAVQLVMMQIKKFLN